MSEHDDLAAVYRFNRDALLPVENYGTDGRWSLLATVDPAGETVLVFRDTDAETDDWARCYDCPPDHEWLGPLPEQYRMRLADRCGASTQTGGWCGIRLHHGHARCHHHRDQP